MNQHCAGQSGACGLRVEDGPVLGALQFPRESSLGQVWSIMGCVLWEAERLPGWELGSWATDILWGSSLWNLGFLTTVGPPAEDRELGLWARGDVRDQGRVTGLAASTVPSPQQGLSCPGPIHAMHLPSPSLGPVSSEEGEVL